MHKAKPVTQRGRLYSTSTSLFLLLDLALNRSKPGALGCVGLNDRCQLVSFLRDSGCINGFQIGIQPNRSGLEIERRPLRLAPMFSLLKLVQPLQIRPMANGATDAPCVAECESFDPNTRVRVQVHG